MDISNKLEKHNILNKNLDKNHCQIWTIKLHEIDCSSFAFSTNISAKQSRPLFVLEESASSQASLSTRNWKTRIALHHQSWDHLTSGHSSKWISRHITTKNKVYSRIWKNIYVELVLPVSLGMSHTANPWLGPFLILKLSFW